MKSLGTLAAAIGLTAAQPDLPISHITADSRQVTPGALFVAYRGVSVDGHRFIPAAIAAGASVIVGETEQSLSVPYLRVADARRALGQLCACWQNNPGHEMGMIGITGTDGKTTTANILSAILNAAGLKTGLLTTVNARIGEHTLDTGLHTTTPDAPDLQRYLRQMADAGSAWAILETTSHGLSQWRVAGTAYDLAIFTNVTHEHLDEHGDYDGYLAAKGRLLELLHAGPAKPGIPRAAILNADDRSFAALSCYDVPRMLSYGIENGDVRAADIRHTPAGLHFSARWGRGRAVEVTAPLVGIFNVYNCLAAISAAFLLDLPDAVIKAGLAAAPQVPGRMERIHRGQDFSAIVDFAHTPYSLEAVLTTARTLTPGRVIVVFGSAGQRDRLKRRMMGEIAGRLADLAIITAEDPRSEDLDAIIAESERACRAAGGDPLTEPDRYRAIQLALRHAEADDIVLICGKGHEQSMCFGATEYPWDDRIALRHALEVYLDQATGPPPLLLPTYS